MDLKRKQFKTEFAGKPLTLEVSRLAEQADAAVLGTYGDTAVLATVVVGEKESDKDYFPLTVNYEEKFYAAGKILGSRFTRREGKSSDEAVLNGRIVDRTIRPLFDQNLRKDIQVVITVLSIDNENEPEFISLLAASTAIAASPIPWNGPVAGIKMAKLKNNPELMINPDNSKITENMDFSAFVAGTKNTINMIELEADEAKQEDVMESFAIAQEKIKELIDWQEKVLKEIAKPKMEVKPATLNPDMKAKSLEFLKDKLEKAIYAPSKIEMEANAVKLEEDLKAYLTEQGIDEEDAEKAGHIIEEETNNLLHEKILKEEKRPDGRKLNQLRDLHAEVGLFKRLHGSALFVRGNTQSMALTTLGAPGDQQLFETMEFSGKKRFLLHYNFPPYSVGETGAFRGPGRREIGHGALAEKALRPLIPAKEVFPYTIRLVSEILSSNGSSSMATVCAGSLSMMDAGVPLKRPAAGIAMGLILSEDGKQFKVLTDIQGPEDHHGDMDFKIAGTEAGVTAMQLDVKILGLNLEIIEKTMSQAKEARLQILEVLKGALPAPRLDLSPFAPRILSLEINPELIGDVIGPGGKIINGIIDETGVTSIDIDDDGKVFITSNDKASAEKAYEKVKMIVKEFNVGDIVEGTVVRIMEFGAIVDIGGGRDGMVHISELKDGYVKKVEDVLKMGDFIQAKIIKIENGKMGLSIKQMGAKPR